MRSIAAALVLVACSGTTSIEETMFAASLNIDLPSMTRTATGLYYRDLVTGGGAVVANGQQVAIHYVGHLASGIQFDANSAPANPFSFTLGSGQVIPGFDQGVLGMRIGGRRQMILPPDLGYGDEAVGTIPRNSILVFTVEVVSAQ